MTGGGWVSPSDHARAIYDNEGGAIPEVPTTQWRPQGAPAFGAEYADQITEQVRIISRWIDGEVERGATDALVAALREKGYAVIEPADRTILLTQTRDAEDWARYPARRTAELIYRIRRALEGKR